MACQPRSLNYFGQHELISGLCVAACELSPVEVALSLFERLLEPGCSEMPDCRCGREMKLTSIEQISNQDDTNIKIYHCSTCAHELRLTVWAVEEVVKPAAVLSAVA